MNKNTSLKFTEESSVTFQSSVSGPGEFGLNGDPVGQARTLEFTAPPELHHKF